MPSARLRLRQEPPQSSLLPFCSRNSRVFESLPYSGHVARTAIRILLETLVEQVTNRPRHGLGNAFQSGSCSSTAANVSGTVAPANAIRPASISYSTQPNDQMSARLSTTMPRTCSGLMYAAVPSSVPSRVPPTVTVGDCRQVGCGHLGSSFARPKSRILTYPSGRDLDIGGFQVTMDDPLLVSRIEPVGDLPRDPERLRRSESAPSPADRRGSARRQAPV